MSGGHGFKARLRRAFADRSLRGLAKNSSLIFSGNSLASMLGVVAYSIAGRALGPAELGLLVTIQTYVGTINGLLGFQSSHCMLQYGANALSENRTDRFEALLKTILIIDMATGTISLLVAMCLVGLAGQWLRWDAETIWMARLYSAVILFCVVGVPTALLQLLDRFAKIASQRVLSSAVNLTGVAIAALCHGGKWGILIAWFVTQALSSIMLYGMAWAELVRRGHRHFLRADIGCVRDQLKPMMKFLLMTNFNSTLRMLVRGPENFVICRYLGPAAVGQYNVGKRFAGMMGLLFDPLSQAVYPELARKHAQGRRREFVRLMLASSLTTASAMLAVTIGFIIFGRWGLALTVGTNYLPAYPVMILLALGFVVAGVCLPLQPAIFAFKRPGLAVVSNVVGGLVFWTVLGLSLGHLGSISPALANLSYYAGWSLIMGLYLMRLMPHFPAAVETELAGMEDKDKDNGD